GMVNMAQMMQNPESAIRRMAKAGADEENLWQEAMKDAYALMNRHYCGTEPLEQFSRHAKAFINNEGAPRLSTDEMMNRCVREAKPNGRYGPKDFCMCFVGVMSNAPMTRAERKGLSAEFWPAAQRIIANRREYYGSC